MHATLVYVHVKPGHLQAFVDATRRNHQASIQEPGNLRFDVLQQQDDPTRFVLYEAYTSADAAAAHKQTAHYLEWRRTVAEWMTEPRRGVVHDGLYPAGDPT